MWLIMAVKITIRCITKTLKTLCLSGVFSFCGMTAFADTVPEQLLVLRDHHFVPPTLVVPAGQRFKLVIKNEDLTAAEFESSELSREKIIPAHASGYVFIDPLDVGRYSFFDDFNHDTANGTIIAQ